MIFSGKSVVKSFKSLVHNSCSLLSYLNAYVLCYSKVENNGIGARLRLKSLKRWEEKCIRFSHELNGLKGSWVICCKSVVKIFDISIIFAKIHPKF